jgi:hypothetical protein
VLAAFLSSLAGLVVLLPLGLILDQVIVYPLAFGVAALLAALAAGWAGTLLAPGATRTRLLPVVVAAEAAAAVLVLAVLVFLAWADTLRPRVRLAPTGRRDSASALASAAAASTCLRSSAGNTRDDVTSRPLTRRRCHRRRSPSSSVPPRPGRRLTLPPGRCAKSRTQLW